MKKFLLLFSCLVFAICAKAAEYEISTALSSPYGMYSTFSVFNNATVHNLHLGAISEDNVIPNGYSLTVFRPMQITNIDAENIDFTGAGINVARDLIVHAPKQSYGNIYLTNFTSPDGTVPTNLKMNFTKDTVGNYAITIANLYANTLVAGELSLNNIVTNTLYAKTLHFTSGFNLSDLRPKELGDKDKLNGHGDTLNISTISKGCGNDARPHYYGQWEYCGDGGVCTVSGVKCADNFTCDDDSDKITRCTEVREVYYNVPRPDSKIIDFKPSVDVLVFYNPCQYGTVVENGTTALQCNWKVPDGPPVEASSYENNAIYPDCTARELNSCAEMCAGRDCSSGAQCKVKTILQEGVCGSSGWEPGSGLECRDAYQKFIYKIYKCPAAPVYSEIPVTSNNLNRQKFTQKRAIVCAPKTQPMKAADKETKYCDMKFLELDYQ